MSDFHRRGIHNDTLRKELKSGSLKPLVELVKTNDDLVLQIRDNYLNVYYQGGNVAKVNSPKSVEFDENYFRTHENKSDENWEEIKKERKDTISLFKEGRFTEYIDKVKSAMKIYWDDVLKGKGVAEKKAQHQICLLNDSHADYTVIDLEYQVSKKSKFRYQGKRRTQKGGLPSPRFDIVAIRNSDHRLCVIELKKGTKALKDPSGVQEHAESYANTIGYNKQTKKSFTDEMDGVVKMLQDLKLLDKKLYIDSSLEPEFIFAYQYKLDDKDKDENVLDFNMQKKSFKDFQNSRKMNNFAKDKKVIWLDDECYLLKD